MVWIYVYLMQRDGNSIYQYQLQYHLSLKEGSEVDSVAWWILHKTLQAIFLKKKKIKHTSNCKLEFSLLVLTRKNSTILPQMQFSKDASILCQADTEKHTTRTEFWMLSPKNISLQFEAQILSYFPSPSQSVI